MCVCVCAYCFASGFLLMCCLCVDGELLLFLSLWPFDQMKQIARQGRELTRQHLRMPDIYCYYFRALSAYSQLLTFEPQVLFGLS